MAATGMMALFLVTGSTRVTDEPLAAILIGRAADMSALSAIGGKAEKRGLVMAIDDTSRAGGVDHHMSAFFEREQVPGLAEAPKILIEDTRTILVVDDSDDDLEATARFLDTRRNPRNQVHRCEAGTEALACLSRTGRYASEIDTPKAGLNLNTPCIDGRDGLTKIKGERSLRTIPMIGMTTSDAKCDIDACYEMVANTHIQKPLNWRGFPAAMNRLRENRFEIAVLSRTET